MRSPRIPTLVPAAALAAALALLAAAPAAAAPGDQLFAGRQVHAIEITFEQPAFWDSLTLFYDEGEERYLPAKVVVNGVTYDDVGVRFKGNSSYTHPNDKKPFRLSFDEFVGSQRLDGLKGVHLNNCWSDPSFLREKLHLDFLRAAGIPGPRANFATLVLNGEPWGFYSLVEHVDKTFLTSRFGNKNGAFFKAVDGEGTGSPVSDFRWLGPDAGAYESLYEIKSDDEAASWPRLLAVIDTLAHAADPAVALPAVVDVPAFARAMAADNLLANLDSYAGTGRNFYVYFDEAGGLMRWIVWDTGLSFGRFVIGPDPRRLPLDFVYDAPGRPLFAKVLGTPALRDAYFAEYRSLFEDVFSAAAMSATVDTLADLVRPHVQADDRKMYTSGQFEQSLVADVLDGEFRVPGLKPFLATRSAEVRAALDRLGPGGAAGPRLAQNRPNPARARTTVAFELASAGRARLEVFDLAGRRVAAPLDAVLGAGPHEADLDVSALAPGLYLYRLRAGTGERSRRMLVLP